MRQVVIHLACPLILLTFVLAGCGGLQELADGPEAPTFHPKSIAVLPPVTGQYEGAREDVLDVLAAALGKGRRFEKVVPPEQMADVFQNSKEAFDALVIFSSKLDVTGQPDRTAAAVIGKALNADALLVARVNAWEYTKKDVDNVAKVGLGLRLIDPLTGSPVWTARHETAKSYMFFKPKLKEVARDLVDEMLTYLPQGIMGKAAKR